MTPLQEPRSGQIAIAGYPWLARMIDKARLEAAGQIDTFDLEYPCPMDQSLLRKLGIDAQTFQQIATTARNDEEVVSALQSHGVPVQTP